MKRGSMRHLVDISLVSMILVGIWQLSSWAVGDATLPSPWHAVAHLAHLLSQPRFLRDINATAYAYAISLGLAMAGGLILGLLCGGARAIGEFVEPALHVLIATPKVMLYPIILLLFGLGDAAKIVFGLLHGLPPVVIIVANALRTLRPIYRKTARIMQLSPTQYALYVMAPAVLPEIATGFRVCFALTLLGVLVGEMFAASRGLGHLLMASIGTNDQPTIMAVTLLLFVFAGVGSSALLALGQSRKLSR